MTTKGFRDGQVTTGPSPEKSMPARGRVARNGRWAARELFRTRRSGGRKGSGADRISPYGADFLAERGPAEPFGPRDLVDSDTSIGS